VCAVTHENVGKSLNNHLNNQLPLRRRSLPVNASSVKLSVPVRMSVKVKKYIEHGE
jgi:hypothetical protein